MRSKTLAIPISIIFLMMFAVAALGGVANPDALRELAAARAATAQYQNAEMPTVDGVVDGYELFPPGDRVPGMGYHYVNIPLMDDNFDAEAPEILLYDDAGSGRRLIAVEYVVAGAEPAGFAGSDDEWVVHLASCHYEDGYEVEQLNPVLCPLTSPGGADFVIWHPNLWALHVWLWEVNPDGIFAMFNPNLF